MKKQKINEQQREQMLKYQEEAKQAKLKRIDDLTSVLLKRIENYQLSKTIRKHWTVSQENYKQNLRI